MEAHHLQERRVRQFHPTPEACGRSEKALGMQNASTKATGGESKHTVTSSASKAWSGWRSNVAPAFSLPGEVKAFYPRGAAAPELDSRKLSSPPLARARSRMWCVGARREECSKTPDDKRGAKSAAATASRLGSQQKQSPRLKVKTGSRALAHRKQERIPQESHRRDVGAVPREEQDTCAGSAGDAVGTSSGIGIEVKKTEVKQAGHAGGTTRNRRSSNSSMELAEVDALLYNNHLEQCTPLIPSDLGSLRAFLPSPGRPLLSRGQSESSNKDSACEVDMEVQDTAAPATSEAIVTDRAVTPPPARVGQRNVRPREGSEGERGVDGRKPAAAGDPGGARGGAKRDTAGAKGREPARTATEARAGANATAPSMLPPREVGRAEPDVATSRMRVTLQEDGAPCIGNGVAGSPLDNLAPLRMVGANRARGKGALVAEAGGRESSANDRRGKKYRPGKGAPIGVSSVTPSASSEATGVETSRALPEQKSSSTQFVRAVPSELETPVGTSRRASRGAFPREPPGVSVAGGVSRRRSSGVRQKGAAGKGNKELAASADVVSESQDGKRGGGALSLRVLIRDESRSVLANAAVVRGSLSESVPLRCASSGKEIATRVRDFLHSGRKVFLLTGAAGSGKSLFAASLARDLIADAAKRTGFLPVLLEAREAEGPWGMSLDSMVEHYLMDCLGLDESAVEVIKRRQRLLIILDGFDAISPDKRRNLWTTNRWANWRAKVLFTSRPAGVTEAFFVPTDRRGLEKKWALETATIAPLDPYEVKVHQARMKLDELPAKLVSGLHVLGTHPASLGLACEFASAAMRAHEEEATLGSSWRVGQLDHLSRASVVADWLEHSISKGPDAAGGTAALLAAEELAVSMYQASRWTTDRIPDNEIVASLMLPLRNGLRAFARSCLLEYLVASRVRRVVLGRGDTRQIRNEATIEGEGRSISWIGTVCFGNGSRCANSAASGDASRGDVVLGFLGEMCATDESFAASLLRIVERSKSRDSPGLDGDLGGVEAASANAMTILCRSGFSFAGRDLSGIRVPGAIMENGVFDGCSLAGADLTRCSLGKTSLRGCKFDGARCLGLEVGALHAARPFEESGGKPRRGGTGETTAGIERVKFAPDGAVLALLRTDGRLVKVLKTESFAEICSFCPPLGYLFSPELLELSPNRSHLLVYAVEDPALKSSKGARSKTLQLWRIKPGEARLLFETPAFPEAPVPAFSFNSGLLFHQHGRDELGIVECASGDSVGLITLRLTGEEEGAREPFGSGDDAHGYPRSYGHDSDDEEWASAGEPVGDHDGPKKATPRGSSTPRRFPRMCSLRVTPDGAKVQVGVESEGSVILEYALDDWQSPGYLRTGHEILNGSRIVDAPSGSGGLHAVIGPDRTVQIRSRRRPVDGGTGNNNNKDSRGNGDPRASAGVGFNPGAVEREIARLRSGDDEQIKEVAFAASGDFFVTRDPHRRRASLWLVGPAPCSVQTLERVCSQVTPECFLLGGKAIILAHEDATVKVYACETGVPCATFEVPCPALAVAAVATSACRVVILAVAGSTVHRWYAPSSVTPAWGNRHENNGDYGLHSAVGAVRSVAALPSDGGGLVLLASDQGLVAMDSRRGSLVSEMTSRDRIGVSHVAVTPDQRTVVSVNERNEVMEWDPRTLALKGRRSLHAEVRSLAISPDSALLAILTFDGVFVYEIGEGPNVEELMSFDRDGDYRSSHQRRDDPVQLAFWDKRTLAIALSRGRIQLHDVNPGKFSSISSSISLPSSGLSTPVSADWIAHCGPVTCMAPWRGDSADLAALEGRCNATRSPGFDLGVGLSGSMHALLLARSPVLATGGGDGKVKVWTEEGRAGGGDEGEEGDFAMCRTSGGGRTRASAAGHEGAVLSLCWHPGGETLASAGQDHVIWLWNCDGRPLSSIQAYGQWTRALTFSHAGDILVSARGTGFEAWAVDLKQEKKTAALRWRLPHRLVAAMAEVGDAVDLDEDATDALRGCGARVGTTTVAAGEVESGMPSPSVGGASWSSIFSPRRASERLVRFDLAPEGEGGEGGEEHGYDTLFLVDESVTDGGGSMIWPRGADLEVKDQNGMTALGAAAKRGMGRKAEALLVAGAAVEVEDDRGYSPLCWAAAGGYSTILRALLFGVDNVNAAFEADPDHTTARGDTPAILAAAGGHLCALAELEEAGADLDRGNHAGETPLIAAAWAGHTEVVAFLAGLEGTDVDKRDAMEGMTALAAAALNGQTESVRVLLMRGADPSIPMNNGRAPVFLAALGGHLSVLYLLLRALGPDRTRESWRPDAAGRTPVMAASANGHLECLRALVEGYDDGNSSNFGRKGDGAQNEKAGQTIDRPTRSVPVLVGDRGGGYAAAQGLSPKVVSDDSPAASVSDGIDEYDNEGKTALMHACMFDQPRCVEYLLRMGARVEISDKEEVTTFMSAAGGGHEACLGFLLAAVEDTNYLNVTDVHGNNACHYACLAGESGALAMLANAGASLDLPSGASRVGEALHPAHMAVAHASLQCLVELVRWGADLEARDGAGETALSLAIQYGSDACAEYLLSGADKGGALVDPNRPGRGQEPPIHAAARRGRLAVVSRLLEVGGNPTVRDKSGETAIHAAAKCGHTAVVALLLQTSNGERDEENDGSGHRGRSIARWWSMTTNAGETATFLAAREGHLGVCQALDVAGALDPSRPNNEGATPMMVAALAGHREVVQMLILGGGDVNRSDSKGRTPAMAAALRGDRSLLESLSTHGARLAARNSDGRTAAFFAAMNGHIDCLAFIVEDSIDSEAPGTADAKDKIGCTPLWTAAAHGHIEILRYLTRHCASPNARDVTGTTAVWMTAGGGDPNCLGVLLEAGADGNLANEDGLTPALIAAQGGHADCLRILAAAGADLNVPDLGGNSAATFAAMGGHLNCLKVLVAADANLDIPNSDGHTPAFAAITRARLECLRYLSAVGADLRRRDCSSGNTPAMVAASHGQTECLRFIVEAVGRPALTDRNEDGLSAACFAALFGRGLTLSAIAQMDPSIIREKDHSTLRSVAHHAAAEGQVSCLRIIAGAAMGVEHEETGTGGKGAAANSTATRASAAGASTVVTGWCMGRPRVGLRHPLADCIDADGESPLHAAARGGHVDAFTYLVSEARLDPDDRNKRGETCVWLAAAHDREDLLRSMVGSLGSINTVDARGRSPVHAAASRNAVRALTVLSEVGRSPRHGSGLGNGQRPRHAGGKCVDCLEPDARDADGASPLHLAVTAGHIEAVTLLCEAGADVNAVDGSGLTSAWTAAATGQADMLELLASKGANLDIQMQTGATLAHIAARYGGSDCLRVLCQRGVDASLVDQAGNTPVTFATVAKDLEGIRVLARYGCDLSRGDIQSVTPAFFAAQEGYAECLALLLALGADGSIARADGATPLIIAAQNGHDHCVAILLDPPGLLLESGSVSVDADDIVDAPNIAVHGSNSPRPPREGLESHTSSGYTALSMAVVAGQRSCAHQLLGAGAYVDAADGKGRSPLYLAAAAGDASMCSLLILEGANPRVKALDGLDPAAVASSRGYPSVARRILRESRLNGDDLATKFTTGMSASSSFMDLEKYAEIDDDLAPSRVANGGDEAFASQSQPRVKQPVAPLLPASVARLRANGRAADSPRSRGPGDAGGRWNSTGHGWLPSRGMQSTGLSSFSILRSNHRAEGHRGQGGSASGPIRRQTIGGTLDEQSKNLQRTWSGVLGGEVTAPAGAETPGRRRPVQADDRHFQSEPVPAEQPPMDRRESRDGGARDSSSVDPRAKPKQQRMSLLDRMTTFLLEIMDSEQPHGDRKGEQSEQSEQSVQHGERLERRQEGQQPEQQRGQSLAEEPSRRATHQVHQTRQEQPSRFASQGKAPPREIVAV